MRSVELWPGQKGLLIEICELLMPLDVACTLIGHSLVLYVSHVPSEIQRIQFSRFQWRYDLIHSPTVRPPSKRGKCIPNNAFTTYFRWCPSLCLSFFLPMLRVCTIVIPVPYAISVSLSNRVEFGLNKSCFVKVIASLLRHEIRRSALNSCLSLEQILYWFDLKGHRRRSTLVCNCPTANWAELKRQSE